jgi:hypothetical protein
MKADDLMSIEGVDRAVEVKFGQADDDLGSRREVICVTSIPEMKRDTSIVR